MKRVLVFYGLFLMLAIFSGFKLFHQSSVIGRITPMDGASHVWAISGKDSVSSPIVNGAFGMSVKQGVYKVYIDATEPYKDASLENIEVKDGANVDLGEIVLQRIPGR